MGHFNYARHFSVLGAATVVLFLLQYWGPLSDSLLVSFALNGALHALSLSLALRSPQSILRKLAFIVLAAALSVFTMYVGIVGLVLFAVVPGNERLYMVLGLCSLSGADHVRLPHPHVLDPKILPAMHFGDGFSLPAGHLPGVLYPRLLGGSRRLVARVGMVVRILGRPMVF